MYEVEEREGLKALTDASQLRLRRALKEGNDESEDIFEFCANEKIEFLELIKCSLTIAPESISRITSLKTLDLSRNRLTALPSSFNQLQHLEFLSICDKSIETFPLAICQMTSLKTLLLFGNKLQSIPELIGNLVNLEWLDLLDNSISKLPVSFHKLTNLEILYVAYNPLVFPPSSMIDEEDDGKEDAGKVVTYMKSYHDSRHRVTQSLSLQRNRDRVVFIETPERFSYTEHTPFAVMDDYLYQYFWMNFIFNECNDGDWPQSEEERREK